MPVLTPVELWQHTKRDHIQELFRLEDRSGRDYVLPMTHEETVTFHAREIQSYKQLPQILYHFAIKERDEPRSRGGAAPAARVHHEGRVLLRPRRGRARRQLPQARRRVRAHVRALRPEVLRGAGGVGDDGRQGVGRLPRPVRLGREHARHLRARGLRGRPRDRARRASRARLPAVPRRAGGRGHAGCDDDRGAGRVPRHRLRRDVEGDARREDRRHARARPGARRRPARGGEAGLGARVRLPARDRRRDPRRRSAPIRARSGRSASAARSSPTRRCARASSSRARTRRAATCAASSTGGTSRRASPTCASLARATCARQCGGRLQLPDGDRDRPHLQVRRRATPSRSARHSSTRTARRSRSSEAATASGPARVMAAIVEQQPGRPRASSGRRRSRPTTCT